MSRIIPNDSILRDETMQVAIVVAILMFLAYLFADGIKTQYGCPACGHVAHPTDVYCAQCGKQIRIRE